MKLSLLVQSGFRPAERAPGRCSEREARCVHFRDTYVRFRTHLLCNSTGKFFFRGFVNFLSKLLCKFLAGVGVFPAPENSGAVHFGGELQ